MKGFSVIDSYTANKGASFKEIIAKKRQDNICNRIEFQSE